MTRKHCLSFTAVAVFLLIMLLPAVAAPQTMFSNMNPDAVKNSPPSLKVLRLNADSRPIRVSQISTYHWNNGRGAQPGTISIWENGKQLGAWQAIGRSGSGADNVLWIVTPNITLYPGHKYEIHDSDTSTWSWNESSGKCGMFELQGSYLAASPKNVANAPAKKNVSSAGKWILMGHKMEQKEGSSGGWHYLLDYKYDEANNRVVYNILTTLSNIDGVFQATSTCKSSLPPSAVAGGSEIKLRVESAISGNTLDGMIWNNSLITHVTGYDLRFTDVKNRDHYYITSNGGPNCKMRDSAIVSYQMPKNGKPGEIYSITQEQNFGNAMGPWIRTIWTYKWSP